MPVPEPNSSVRLATKLRWLRLEENRGSVPGNKGHSSLLVCVQTVFAGHSASVRCVPGHLPWGYAMKLTTDPQLVNTLQRTGDADLRF